MIKRPQHLVRGPGREGPVFFKIWYKKLAPVLFVKDAADPSAQPEALFASTPGN